MKRVFLLIVVPALLVALGFAQTPTANSNTDQSNIKGCLGGSDGNYTLAQDNTGQTFKLTASGVDLKPHVGHDVKLIGNKASGAASSGAADNSFAVIALSMISEHCGAAAAAPAATVSTPAETVIAPAAPAAAAPGTTANAPAASAVATPETTLNTPAAPAATDSRPAMAAAAPDTTVSAPAAPATAVAAAAPDTSVKKTSDIGGAPAASAAQPTRPSARTRKPPATPAVVATPPETASAPAPAAAAPDTTASAPAAAAATPAAPAKGGSWILISVVVLVLVLGALVPLVNRWRKRKLLEQTSAQNLSFTHEASSDHGKSDKPEVRKAA